MNRFFITLMLLVCLLPTQSAGNETSLRDNVRSVVDSVVSAGKDVVTGVSQGVESALSDAERKANLKIVSDRETLEKLLTVTVLRNEKIEGQTFRITLGLHNQNDFPVRLARLGELSSVVLLDQDDYAYVLPDAKEQGKDVVVLAKSRTRVRFTFTRIEGKPAVIRIFNKDYKLPEPVSQL